MGSAPLVDSLSDSIGVLGCSSFIRFFSYRASISFELKSLVSGKNSSIESAMMNVVDPSKMKVPQVMDAIMRGPSKVRMKLAAHPISIQTARPLCLALAGSISFV